MTAWSEPVHPSRGRAVWVEETDAGESTVVHCNAHERIPNPHTGDATPSFLHSEPLTTIFPTRQQALDWAFEHSAQHGAGDALAIRVRRMPPYAHRPGDAVTGKRRWIRRPR